MDYPKKSISCQNCGEIIDCSSNAQRYCQPSDNPACYDERVTKKMSWKEFLKYRGVFEGKEVFFPKCDKHKFPTNSGNSDANCFRRYSAYSRRLVSRNPKLCDCCPYAE